MISHYAKKLKAKEIAARREMKQAATEKYNEAKMDAAALAIQVLNPIPSFEKIAEMVAKMKGYMPPDQVDAWLAEYQRRRVQLRTFQNPWEAYDITMTDKEEWEMKKKRGDAKGECPSGYNPAVFKIRDERGDTWNVTGADGFRMTRKTKEWGNHMKRMYDVPAITSAEIEVENKVFVGNRWLTKEKGEHILEDSFGLSRFVNKFYKDRGWDPNSKGAKLMKKYGTKAWLLLRQHPLFDDPVWAFWNILNELKEYGAEVQKEMLKDIAK